MAIHDVTGRKSGIQVKIDDENYKLKFSGRMSSENSFFYPPSSRKLFVI